MGIIDSHCHLEKFAAAGELGDVIRRANEASVSQFITVGTSIEDWSVYRDLAANHPGQIFWTAGIHPCHVDEGWYDQAMALSVWFADGCTPVALGEIGLDHFHLPKFPDEIAEIKKLQEAAFRHQLSLALQFDCPVVVHSRNAFHECVKTIDESGVDWKKVVFHCFSEGPEEVEILNERGGCASFTGIITYKSAENVRQAALAQGLERIMIETDAPYLSPVPHRGKPCEPAYVAETAKFCAELFGVSMETFVGKATENTRRFFELEC